MTSLLTLKEAADVQPKSLAEAAEIFRTTEVQAPGDVIDFDTERKNRPPRFIAVVADYKAGMNVEDIAEKYQCSRGTVMRYARMAGLPKRPKHFDSSVLSQTVDLYRAGMPIAKISDLLGVSQAYVSKAAVAAGIARKRDHRRASKGASHD